MASMTVLTEADLRTIVKLDLDAIACVENAFKALATLPVAMPPVVRLDVPEHRGEVDIKTAYVPGIDGFAVKISPGFFDNPKLGLPSLNGMMVLLSSRTGLIDALLLDNGYLTDIRTAAAGAVAAKHLARADAEIAAVFGAGVQAGLQLEALTLVRPIKQARIFSRDAAKAAKLASSLRDKLRIDVIAEPSAERAIADCDIVVTATPSSVPLLTAGMISPGLHITAMGSDSAHKNELEPAVISRADVYVADKLSQTRLLGELHHALAAGEELDEKKMAELGDIVAGLRSGRSSRLDVTVADLTGTGVQDTAIATLARDRAKASAKIGTIFHT